MVVQKDGTRVTFVEPPRSESGRLVGRLQGSGTLVSIPETRVDAPATARANVPGAVAPAPTRAPTPRPFQTPPLGNRVRLSKTGEEAQRVLEGARPAPTRTSGPGQTPPSGTTPAPTETPQGEPVDRLGRGEDYWRQRAAGLRSALEEAERELAQAEADLEAAEKAYFGPSDGERTTFVVRLIEARDRAARARREHGQSSVRWQAFEEEARKAGAFPGWLR